MNINKIKDMVKKFTETRENLIIKIEKEERELNNILEKGVKCS